MAALGVPRPAQRDSMWIDWTTAMEAASESAAIESIVVERLDTFTGAEGTGGYDDTRIDATIATTAPSSTNPTTPSAGTAAGCTTMIRSASNSGGPVSASVMST